MDRQLGAGVVGQDVSDLCWRIAVGSQRRTGEQAPARWARVHLNVSLITVVEHCGQPIELPVRSRHVCEPIGEKRDRRTIDLPEGADPVERFLRRPVQHRRLEQRSTSGRDDVSILFAAPTTIDHRGAIGPIVAHHARVNPLHVGQGEQRRPRRQKSPDHESGEQCECNGDQHEPAPPR